jgi:hypothetical protein
MSKAVKTWFTFSTLGLAGLVIKSFLKKPKLPPGNAVNEKQPRPLVKYGFGIARDSGSYAKRQSVGNVFVQIVSFPEGMGPVDHYGRAWLNEDEVKPLGAWFQELDDGRYETGRAKYYERMGTQVQSAYAEIIGAPWGWTAQHYGTGIPSNLLILEHGKKEDAQKQFPAGQQTELTREMFYTAYDWRKDDTAGGAGPQRRYGRDATPEEIDAATATWEVTTNPVVGLVNVEWLIYGADWDECFAPTLDILTAEANVCDEEVLLRNGSSQVAGTANPGSSVTLLDTTGLQAGSDLNIAGKTLEVLSVVGDVVTFTAPFTEKLPIFAPARWVNAVPVYGKRYEIGTTWEADEQRKAVRDRFIGAMDGHFSIREDGGYVIRAGHYYAPTVIFGAPEIIDWEYDPGPQIGEAPNVLTLSFKDPVAGYKDTDTDEWRNDSDITVSGREVVDDFSPEGVRGDSQLKRLAKAKMSRDHAPMVSIRTPLSGRRGLGERFIGLRVRGRTELNDAVMEVLEPPRISLLDTPSIVWTGKLATATRYTWNAETEEGNGPIAGYFTSGDALTAPTIDSISVTFQDSGAGPAPRLEINGSGPDRGDLNWFYRARTAGDADWLQLPATDSDPSPDFTLVTGAVQAVSALEVQVAYATAGDTLSPWGPEPPFEIDTTTEHVPPGPPTDLDATGSAGAALVSWRNPASFNFDNTRVYRGVTTTFGSATLIATEAGAAGALDSFNDTGLAAGTYYYWVMAYNAGGDPSAPVGPDSATVT